MNLIKNQNLVSTFLLLLVLLFTHPANAATNDVVVPRETVIPAVATMEMSSQSLIQGQNVSVTVTNDFYYNNNLVVPLGSSINGTVTSVQKADKNGNEGKLGMIFTNIVTPYGTVIPISGMLKTEDGTGIVKGNVTKDNIDEIIKGAVKGSAAGSFVGTKNNEASRIGGAVGAGIAASSTTKARPAVVTVGTVVNIVLNQQSTFKAVQGYQY